MSVGLRLAILTLVATFTVGPMVTSAHPAVVRTRDTPRIGPLAFERAVREGKRLRNIVVREPLDLRRLGTLPFPLYCVGCVFVGPVIADAVVFAQGANLTGSKFRTRASFAGATFKGGFSCTHCVFAGSMSAAGATFQQPADFRGASFQRAASFLNAVFQGDALFVGAEFDRDATFSEARFHQAADFTEVAFLGGVAFHHTQLSEGVSFVADEFLFDGDFSFLTSGGNVDFSFALFDDVHPNAEFAPNGMEFAFLTSKGAVDFSQAEIEPGVTFDLNKISTPSLTMNVNIVDHLRSYGEKVAIVKQIQSSAKASGDLNAQNDAQYELQVLTSQKYSWPLRILDFVFYRSIAGYFVRPLNPLIVWILFVAVMAATRLTKRTDLRVTRGSDPAAEDFAQ